MCIITDYDINENCKPIWKQLPKVTDLSIHFKVCKCKRLWLKYCGSGVLSYTERCGWKKMQKAQYVIKLSLNYISYCLF